MSNIKMTIAGATLLLVLLIIFVMQLVSQHRSAYNFICRGNISILDKSRNFTGTLQVAVNQGKGAVTLTGIYTDEQGVRHHASIHNELNHLARHNDLYVLQFAKATVVPESLTTNSTLMSMFNPYLFNGQMGRMFYHIFTQPSGNRVIAFGKIPELVCQTPD